MILASGSETHRRILWAALAFVVLAGTQPTKTSQGAAVRLPSKLESYLTAVVRPTPAERKRLMDGAPITKLLDADPNREVVVFGAVWINAPVKRYVEAVNDIENFERGGGFRVTKRISTPPRQPQTG